jgi:hypothetical protein
MPLSEKETEHYLERLHVFLSAGHTFVFRKMRGWQGFIKDVRATQTTIELDHRKLLFSTLLHEFLHHEHPEWSETKVLRMECLFVNSLTDLQVRTVIKRFAEAL